MTSTTRSTWLNNNYSIRKNGRQPSTNNNDQTITAAAKTAATATTIKLLLMPSRLSTREPGPAECAKRLNKGKRVIKEKE